MDDPNKSANANINADTTVTKSDLDSKLAAVTTQIAQLNEQFKSQMQELTSAFIAPRNAPKPQESEKLDRYSDDYEDRLAEKIAMESEKRTSRMINANTEKQAMLANLAGDYPELNDANSDFSKSVVKAHQALEKSLQGTAIGYKLAAREAAAEMGIVIRSKRPSTEEYTVKGSGGASRSQSKKSPELQEETLIAAQLMGLDTSDEKLIARLKASREKFGDFNVQKYK